MIAEQDPPDGTSTMDRSLFCEVPLVAGGLAVDYPVETAPARAKREFQEWLADNLWRTAVRQARGPVVRDHQHRPTAVLSPKVITRKPQRSLPAWPPPQRSPQTVFRPYRHKTTPKRPSRPRGGTTGRPTTPNPRF